MKEGSIVTPIGPCKAEKWRKQELVMGSEEE